MIFMHVRISELMLLREISMLGGLDVLWVMQPKISGYSISLDYRDCVKWFRSPLPD